MSKKSLDLIQGTLGVLILKTISRKPMHGYAISQWIRERTDDLLVVQDAALYQALRRLEGRGWVESEWGRSENQRRARFYRLTPKGKKQLEQATSDWKSYAAAVFRILDFVPEPA